jgi:hypothetical protein
VRGWRERAWLGKDFRYEIAGILKISESNDVQKEWEFGRKSTSFAKGK